MIEIYRSQPVMSLVGKQNNDTFLKAPVWEQWSTAVSTYCIFTGYLDKFLVSQKKQIHSKLDSN